MLRGRGLAPLDQSAFEGLSLNALASLSFDAVDFTLMSPFDTKFDLTECLRKPWITNTEGPGRLPAAWKKTVGLLRDFHTRGHTK